MNSNFLTIVLILAGPAVYSLAAAKPSSKSSQYVDKLSKSFPSFHEITTERLENLKTSAAKSTIVYGNFNTCII